MHSPCRNWTTSRIKDCLPPVIPRLSRLAFSRTRLLLLCLLLLAVGCSDQPPKSTAPALPLASGCRGCHSAIQPDQSHAFPCIDCHLGQDQTADREAAHRDLIAQPAHPKHFAQACGPCHQAQVASMPGSSHFTLANEVNQIRIAFGARKNLGSLHEIPVSDQIDSPLALADDLLRRRCLRCHLGNPGEEGYPETRRGTGCAACHLPYSKGKMTSHAFIKSPPDTQCLHCHYGNRVGADYHGRFEHDFNFEYRTPYTSDPEHPRPYGLEFHQLRPDIHQQAGMACIDCHSGSELMGGHRPKKTGGPNAGCLSCHGWQPGMPLPPGTSVVQEDRLTLKTKLGGKVLTVPPLRDPAHRFAGNQADCAVCHAQWSFNDSGVHLLRRDDEHLAPWSRLAVQGNAEVEWQLDRDEFASPQMTDAISGESRPGIWLLGYGLRRWELPLIGRDHTGRLRVFRPVLDLHLSWVDQDGRLVFDNLTPPQALRHRPYISDHKGNPEREYNLETSGLRVGQVAASGTAMRTPVREPDRSPQDALPCDRLRPYTPHTIGKAGAFWRERLAPRQ